MTTGYWARAEDLRSRLADRTDEEEISLLPRRISFIIEFERSEQFVFFLRVTKLVKRVLGQGRSRTRPDDPVARTVSNKCAAGREHARNRAIRSHGNFNYQFSIR